MLIKNKTSVFTNSVFLLFSIFSALYLSLTLGQSVLAASNCGSDGVLGIPAWFKGLKMDSNCAIIETDAQVISTTIAINVTEILLQVVIYVAIGMIIYGAYRYLLSGGSSSNVEAGKRIIQNSIIGLIIALLARLIVSLVFRSILGVK